MERLRHSDPHSILAFPRQARAVREIESLECSAPKLHDPCSRLISTHVVNSEIDYANPQPLKIYCSREIAAPEIRQGGARHIFSKSSIQTAARGSARCNNGRSNCMSKPIGALEGLKCDTSKFLH